jgi:hypothetical protein
MVITRTLAALSLALTFAGAAFAQEFGRASGGELEVGIKTPSKLSGSLSIELPFLSSNGGKRGGATFGGALVKDRLWFFGSAEQMTSPRFSPAAGGFDTNLSAQLGDRQSLGAALRSGRDLAVAQPSTPLLTTPSSFLSLRYTGIVSSNSFFTASFARSSRQQAPSLFGQP